MSPLEQEEQEQGEKGEATAEKLPDTNPYGSIVTHGGSTVQTMLIAGQIEGHQVLPATVKSTRYEEFLPRLVQAQENDEVEGILLLIHTVGGDVEAGLAMAEMIAGITKPTVSLVLGGGHSIGIPLAVAAKHTFIAPTATMTVHPVRINGLVLGVPQSFEYLKKMQERICRFITEHSHIKREDLDRLMAGRHDMATDIGTIVEGREAVRLGLADNTADFSQAMQYLKEQINARCHLVPSEM